MISEVDSKTGGFTSLKRSYKSLYGEILKTANSAVMLNYPLSATSLVSKERWVTLGQPPSDIHGLSEEVQIIGDATQTVLPITNSIIGNTSQTHSPIANIHPHLGSLQDKPGPDKSQRMSVNSSDQIEMGRGKKMKKSGPVSMTNVSRIGKLDALQSKISDILKTSNLRTSQRIM